MTKELKYKMIENYVLKKIHTGEYKVGEQIPTEYELCEMFHVGRMTVNKAINNLERRNLIRRISGKGSFVIKRASRSVTALGSFTKDMERVGMKASAKLVEYRIATGADFPTEAYELEIKPEDQIIYFKRIRYGDNIIIALSETYLVESCFPNFNPNVLDGSLDEYMASEGYTSEGFMIRIEAMLAQKEQKKYLELPFNEEVPLLKSITKRYYEGKVFEYTKTYYISNHFEYTFTCGIDGK